MTRIEHLLCIVAEECAEVAQRASKAQRFGLREVEPGQILTNAQRLSAEYADLVAVLIMLSREDEQVKVSHPYQSLEAKRVKVEAFLEYSASVGTVTGHHA